ncbi:hypothetical protein V8E55_006660, partial [Tylopilus felleus]
MFWCSCTLRNVRFLCVRKDFMMTAVEYTCFMEGDTCLSLTQNQCFVSVAEIRSSISSSSLRRARQLMRRLPPSSPSSHTQSRRSGPTINEETSISSSRD